MPPLRATAVQEKRNRLRIFCSPEQLARICRECERLNCRRWDVATSIKHLTIELAIANADEVDLPITGELLAMAQDERTHNQPSHEAQVKGGQHSHQGQQSEQSVEQDEQKGGNRTPPSREEASKGGQHSHSGSKS